MRAFVYERYGPPEVLELIHMDEPVPAENQVLIRVHATSINASDSETLRGKPLYARMAGPLKPKQQILGSDVAGTIEAIGTEITEFQVGDEVVADTLYHGAGALADYVAVAERAPLVLKPQELTFEEAAAIPQALVIAMQGLAKRPDLAGARVLINGGGGGSGTFAIQLAKRAGAAVTAVDNELKLELMRSLGADHVIDYTRESFTKSGARYDLILDLAGHRSINSYRRSLARGGTYAMVGGSMSSLIQAGLVGPMIAAAGTKRLGVLIVKPGKQALGEALDAVTAGLARPVIDRIFPLEKVPEAFRRHAEGRALGKVVIRLAGEGG